ncbi:MAG: 5-formyltetrahydrofolate cyclo-ligase [Tannerella sp.]|jgi:hypothetical protein|nr:5-formyltetrahydrofolate cyclo-ligase [Tannerella sp.]
MDDSNKNTDNTRDRDAGEYITILMSYFRPAGDEKDATHYLTTSEVSDAIRRLDPGAGIRSEDVYKAMLAAGFRYGYRPGTLGIDFRWMLHEK